jgi:hypothetical protein
MGSRANYVIVDEHGWRLHYSHWGAARIHAQLAAGPAYARRFIEEQQRCEPNDWLDDLWGEGGVLMDTVARRLLFFGGGDELHRLGFRRAYFALLGQTWPGWTVGWAYKGIGEIASGVDVVLVGDPLAFTADATLLAEAAPDEIAEGYWTLLTVRSGSDEVRAWPVTPYGPVHLVWGGEPLLNVLPDPGRARESFDGPPPAFGLHLDLPGRRLGWWTASSSGPRELVEPRWPGWAVQFWEDRYEEQVSACAGALRLPAVDPLAGLAEVEESLAEEDDDPVGQALRILGQSPGGSERGGGLWINPDVAAHAEVTIEDDERRVVAAGLAAVRAQWSKR